jgi:hypothetical protein
MTNIESIEALNEAVCKLLRDNLTDPLNRGVNWIFIDYPKKKIDRFPMVAVLETNVYRDPIGIGDQGNRLNVSYAIEVWNKSTDEATIDDKRYAASKLRDYLGDQIITILANNRAYMTNTYGILDMMITTVSNSPYDPETDLYTKTIMVVLMIDKFKS